eukprot:6118355-Ditylum_brightwellii.AAC.1
MVLVSPALKFLHLFPWSNCNLPCKWHPQAMLSSLNSSNTNASISPGATNANSLSNCPTVRLPCVPPAFPPSSDNESQAGVPYDGLSDLHSATAAAQANSTNPSYHPYLFLNCKLDDICHVYFSKLQGFLLCCQKGVADSRVSCHMLNDKAFFTSFTETPGVFVLLADKTWVPVLGKGTARIDFLGKVVQVPDCFYVPALQGPLYFIHHHRRYQGYSFLADNE